RTVVFTISQSSGRDYDCIANSVTETLFFLRSIHEYCTNQIEKQTINNTEDVSNQGSTVVNQRPRFSHDFHSDDFLSDSLAKPPFQYDVVGKRHNEPEKRRTSL